MPQPEASSSVAFDGLAVTLGCASIAALFQRHAPEAYMDEPFHVNQTAQYCKGDWAEWDPKITTLPGLYLLGAPYGRAAHAALGLLRPQGPACSTTVLRSMNVLLATAFFVVFQQLYRRLHPQKTPEFATLMALMALLLPTHFFYAFLYYTDVGGVTLVLACYLASLCGRHHLSAPLGAAAILFRQTNAVWVAFILGAAVLRTVAPEAPKLAQLPAERQLLLVLRGAWLHKGRIAARLWSMAGVLAAFGAFVYANGGIVVGDKANHEPVLHAMQLPYLALFCAGALAPVHFGLPRVYEAARQLRVSLHADATRTLRLWGSLALLTGNVVHYYTLAHPFLLADNRHYTFYLWKDFLGAHPAARFTLVPAYVYSGWSLWQALLQDRRTPVLWVLGFVAACAAALLPAWLLEPRYFTVPFMFMLLHCQPPSSVQASLTLALYAVVNVAAICVFLFRPFTWPDGSIARFIF